MGRDIFCRRAKMGSAGKRAMSAVWLAVLPLGCYHGATPSADPSSDGRPRPASGISDRLGPEADSIRWARHGKNLPEGITWQFYVPCRTFRLGVPVSFHFVVRNEGLIKRLVMFPGAGPPVFGDVIIADSRGRMIWSRINGPIESTMIGITMSPGDSLVASGVWDQRDQAGNPVQPGGYLVEGHLHPRLLDYPQLKANPVTIVIR